MPARSLVKPLAHHRPAYPIRLTLRGPPGLFALYAYTLLQLALVLLLRDRLLPGLGSGASAVQLYDPAFDHVDRAALEQLGMQVGAARRAEGRAGAGRGRKRVRPRRRPSWAFPGAPVCMPVSAFGLARPVKVAEPCSISARLMPTSQSTPPQSTPHQSTPHQSTPPLRAGPPPA